MAKDTEIDIDSIDKDELKSLFERMTDNLLRIESHREDNNEVVKQIKELTGFKPTAIRAAATALYKRQRDSLEEKQSEILSILDMVES
jgi:hypothetical protein